MEEHVSFQSGGLRISGVLQIPPVGATGVLQQVPPDATTGVLQQIPETAADAKPRAAVIVLHGFGSNKNGGISLVAAKCFAALGYVTLRFDMRGCGDSEGVRGRVICLEQVEDARNAFDYLAARPEVDPKRICLMGFSFGAAVAVYAAGVDSRYAACISIGGWGDGEKKFRKQHGTPEAWKKFSDMLARGRDCKQRGKSIMVPRFDIVPMPAGLGRNLAPGTIMEFPFEVVESMCSFRANDVVGAIAPRPLLLVHTADDSVTPTEQSIELFLHAGQPTDLHLVAGTDHFVLAEGNDLVINLVSNWLARYFPLHATA